MAKAIFIVGLPGSGKSTRIKKLENDRGVNSFDDFKANAINGCSRFPFSRNYVDLIVSLRSGNDCIISDIDFCLEVARQEAFQCISELVQDVEFVWIYFENDLGKATRNIKVRAERSGRDARLEIRKAAEYHQKYVIPPNVENQVIEASVP